MLPAESVSDLCDFEYAVDWGSAVPARLCRRGTTGHPELDPLACGLNGNVDRRVAVYVLHGAAVVSAAAVAEHG